MGTLGSVRCVFCCVLGILSASHANSAQFEVSALGPESALPHGVVTDLNNKGQVVGWYTEPEGVTPFLWKEGIITPLPASRDASVYVLTLNDNGQMAGRLEGTEGSKAVMWTDRKLHVLDNLPGKLSGWELERVNGINNKGTMVGSAFREGICHPFVFQNGRATDIGVPAGYDQAFGNGINNKGDVVGWAFSPDGDCRAFLYRRGRTTLLDPLGYSCSQANAVNDSGLVVGCVETGGTRRAVQWQQGVGKILGPLDKRHSEALAVNNKGVIVGRADALDGVVHAVIWTDGTMLDLNDLIGKSAEWVLYEAFAINESGQIIGMGSHNKKSRAFLLTSTQRTK